jgi:hypothetical protein
MFTVHPDFSINQPLAQFFVAQLINHEWLQSDGANQLFPAASDITDGAGHTLVTAYAVKRPDGQWSIMLINKDQENSHGVRLEFTGAHAQFSGAIEESLFGRAQYHWTPPQREFDAHMPESRNEVQKLYTGGHADPDGPIAHQQVSNGKEVELPAASVVVLRGKLD